MANFAAEGNMSYIKVYISLGSNLGDRRANIERAITEIDGHLGKVKKRSSYYESSPWGKTDQPDFLNVTIELMTEISPMDLLHRLQMIEKSGGRQRKEHWGPRTIDLDILFFGNHVMKTDTLIIPHPELTNRRFVLLPLSEIAGDVIHPVDNQTIAELLAQCKDRSDVIPYKGI